MGPRKSELPRFLNPFFLLIGFIIGIALLIWSNLLSPQHPVLLNLAFGITFLLLIPSEKRSLRVLEESWDEIKDEIKRVKKNWFYISITQKIRKDLSKSPWFNQVNKYFLLLILLLVVGILLGRTIYTPFLWEYLSPIAYGMFLGYICSASLVRCLWAIRLPP